MVSKCEPPPGSMRSKLDYSGGIPLQSPDWAGCASARVRMPIDIAELPIHSAVAGCAAAALRQSGHHVGGKILKFFKLRKKANDSSASSSVSQEALQPALTTFRFQEQGSKRFASVEDVDLERYHYDSDEEQSSGGASERRRRHSCSTSASSSTRSSASAQSFRSMTGRSCYTTPRTSFIAGSGHQSSAQLMANILISISHLDEDDDVKLSESVDDYPALNGPHESMWHQTCDEILAGGAKISSSAAKQSSSGRNTPRISRCSLDVHLTSPGPSRRFGKLDLSRIETKLR